MKKVRPPRLQAKSPRGVEKPENRNEDWVLDAGPGVGAFGGDQEVCQDAKIRMGQTIVGGRWGRAVHELQRHEREVRLPTPCVLHPGLLLHRVGHAGRQRELRIEQGCGHDGRVP